MFIIIAFLLGILLGQRDFFLSCPACFFHTPHTHPPPFLLSSSVSVSYFILAVPMSECLEKHWCMSSPYPVAILNGTFFFHETTLSKRSKCRQSKTNYNDNILSKGQNQQIIGTFCLPTPFWFLIFFTPLQSCCSAHNFSPALLHTSSVLLSAHLFTHAFLHTSSLLVWCMYCCHNHTSHALHSLHIYSFFQQVSYPTFLLHQHCVYNFSSYLHQGLNHNYCSEHTSKFPMPYFPRGCSISPHKTLYSSLTNKLHLYSSI